MKFLNPYRLFFFLPVLLFCLFVIPASSQKIALVSPENGELNKNFVQTLENSFADKIKIVDSSLAATIFKVSNFETPFNLTTEQSKNLGAAIGCNYLVLIKAENLRRSTFERKEFYEAYASLFLVSSRTGRLVFWELINFEENSSAEAEQKLLASVPAAAKKLSDQIKPTEQTELSEKNQEINQPPLSGSPEAENFRPPLPYRRISPEYTKIASLYNVAATIDILVDIDADGGILRTEIIRWAGFGLDEAVEQTVRRMNWRPADRNGKPLPVRVLLRYNFKNIESDE